MAGTGHASLRDDRDVLLTVRDLEVEFPVGRHDVVHAVSGVSFDVAEGETLGIVGESGCGKSTVAKSIVRLNDIKSGSIDYQGNDLAHMEGEALRQIRPDVQMIFQDPISSLNPRRKIRDVISEGIAVWGNTKGSWSQERIEELIESTGTPAVSAIYKRLSKITEALVEEIRKKQGASARALKPETHTKSISEAVFDELKLLASVRVVPGKSSKELLAESGLIGEFFQTKELVFLVSKIQREVAENRLHEAGKTIGTLLVMLEEYPGDISIIIEQVKEVENLLSKHEKVNFGPALTFISELLTRGR